MHTRINEIVKQSKLTKTDFAKKLGISQPYLSQICAGQKIPSDRTISDLCREFGVDEIWLRTGEGEPFRQLTREEDIMRFAVQTVKGSDSFRKAFVAMMAKLDPEDWQNLARIYEKLAAEYKKD